jgi:hypothetical protein
MPGKIQFGVCFHPAWPEYAFWTPANAAAAMGLAKQLGCAYVRCSLDMAQPPYSPQNLDMFCPAAAAAGLTALPVMHPTVTPGLSYMDSYKAEYPKAKAFVAAVVAKGYKIPAWEIGNEMEDAYYHIISDGTIPAHYTEKTPGNEVALIGAIYAWYDALHAGYKAAGLPAPIVMIGGTYYHWGFLQRIYDYQAAEHFAGMPCDAIAWHWYQPQCQSFNAPLSWIDSPMHGKVPAECLAAFPARGWTQLQKGAPSMLVWITETNRMVAGTPAQNGSYSNTAPGNQDQAAQGAQITATIADLSKAPNVQAIFVFELYDEPKAYAGKTGAAQSEFFGLVANGVPKLAFTAYQTAIKNSQAT